MHDLKKIYRDRENLNLYLPVPRDTVRAWMEAGDTASLSMVHALLTDDTFTAGVEPPLEMQEFYPFSLGLIERCIKEDPQPVPGVPDIITRERAGAEALRWFYQFWNDETQQGRLRALKNCLAGLVLKGDADVRGAIYDSFFDQLGESAMRYFSDWDDDTVLAAFLKYYKPKRVPRRRAGDAG